jgi:hypothetical protein
MFGKNDFAGMSSMIESFFRKGAFWALGGILQWYLVRVNGHDKIRINGHEKPARMAR